MHIQLTDILTCPVCGPEYGLIARADLIVERRIREGALGCPNCRRQYPILAGVAHLDAAPPEAETRPTGAAQQPAGADLVADRAAAVRIAALLGLGHEAARASGFVALVGTAAPRAGDVAALVEGQEFVAVSPGVAALDDAAHVSRIATASKLPFYTAKLRAIWVGGEGADGLLEEAARTLHPMGRLVLDPAPAHARERLAARGLRVLAHEHETLVATRT